MIERRGRKTSIEFAIDYLIDSLTLSIPCIRENTLNRRTASSLGKLSCPNTGLAQGAEDYNIEFSSSKIGIALLHKLAISHDVHRVQVQM